MVDFDLGAAARAYRREGLHVGWFSWTAAVAQMRCLLLAMADPAWVPPPTHRWEQKYPGTVDLRPDVVSLDPCFLAALGPVSTAGLDGGPAGIGVPDLVDGLVGTRMTLAHVQVRVSDPGGPYMGWHRDTHDYDGTPAGLRPSAHKLIHYPSYPDEAHGDVGTRVLGGTHLVPAVSRSADDALVRARLSQGPFPRGLMTSDRQFLFYDTACLHAPSETSRRSLRVIYTFVRPEQVGAMVPDDPDSIHVRTSRAYEAARASAPNEAMRSPAADVL